MYTIEDLAYEMYKLDWKATHLSKKLEQATLRAYFYESTVRGTGYEFEQFLLEYGYAGIRKCYVTFDEFMENQYLQEKYIKELLAESALIEKYENDLAMFKDKKEE